MNKRLFLPALLLVGVAAIAWKPVAAPSRIAQPSASVTGRHDDSDSDDKKDSRKPPFNGMTKAQARHFYGEPDSIGRRDGEELWTYVLNRGTVIAKSFIPFGTDNHFRYRLLTFRGDRVVEFRWDKPDDD